MDVELDIFSGRPNPRWSLAEPQNELLLSLIASLQPATALPPQIPGLGYRGFLIEHGGQKIRAFCGFIKCREGTFSDPNLSIECGLKESMPVEFEALKSLLGSAICSQTGDK